jgi:hypothetical protein
MMQQHDLAVDKVPAGNIPTARFKPVMHFFCESAMVDVDSFGASPKYADLPEGFGGSGKTVELSNADSTVAKAQP